MRILCAGCTGLIGGHLLPELLTAGHDLVVLSRDPDRARDDHPAERAVDWRRWDGERVPDDLGGLDAVINLCGAGIADRRWSAARKRVLRDSRTGPSASLARLVADNGVPLLVQASAIGWYGVRDEPVDETAPAGQGFLAGLTAAWEASVAPAEPTARVLRLRIGAVLSPRGGARAKMLPPIGPLAWLGSGRQPLPWIHAEDVVGMILSAIDGAAWSGAVNAVAPEAVDLRSFIRSLGQIEGRWVLPLGVPGPAIRLAVGEMAGMLLRGARVVPARAQDLGYAWRHARLDDALAACRDAGKDG